MTHDLFGLIESVSGAPFAGIIYECDGGIPKKVGVGKVTKVVDASVQLNYDYTKAVKNRIKESGGDPESFKGEGLPWGEWEIPNKVITNKGERYLRYYQVENSIHNIDWYCDGAPATEEQIALIKEYLADKKKDSKKQSEAGLAEHQVKPNVVKFSNIRSLKCGEVYEKEA